MTVHVARGYESHLPFLEAGRAVICISDWQMETATQRQLWKQTIIALVDEIGAEALSRALVLVAGDMASSSNELRGVKSDAAPDISWLRESIPQGDVLIVYGNHDLVADEQFGWRNPSSGLPCLLPHGGGMHVGLTMASVAAAAAAEEAAPHVEAAAAPATEAAAAPAAEAAAAPAAEDVEAGDEAPAVPAAEQLAGLTKQQRAALWAGVKVHERKCAKPTKKDRQEKQLAAQFPLEARVIERVRALHAGHGALRLPFGSSAQAPAAAPAAASAAASTRTEASTSSVIVGGVHGIPSSHTQGLRKIERADYFRAVDAACAVPQLDVLVTHSNPKLAGQDEVRGEDAPRLLEAFMKSSARLFVHGHMHTEPAVSIVADGKVVANSDARVIVFVPPSRSDPVVVT